jgi:anti-sigma factor RsiW
MTRDELEFQISQYLDDMLSPGERAALELILASDGEARAMLAEYRRLDEHLSRDLPLPNVKWEQLAEHLSAAVAEVDEEPVVVGRIGAASSAWTWRSRLAIAASIVLVLGSGLLLFDANRRGGGHGSPMTPDVPAAPLASMVLGPQAEPATGPVMQQITVGPSPALAAGGDSWRYAEGVVTRPSTAVIAGEMKPPSDGDSHIH